MRSDYTMHCQPIDNVIVDLYGSQSAFRLRVERCMTKMQIRAKRRPLYPDTPIKIRLAKQRYLR